jgi:hypothetical protein
VSRSSGKGSLHYLKITRRRFANGWLVQAGLPCINTFLLMVVGMITFSVEVGHMSFNSSPFLLRTFLHKPPYSFLRLNFLPAIAQSGYFVPSAAFNRSAIYERTWQRLLSESGCQDLSCLRTLPLDQFTAALQTAGVSSFQPVIDGDFIQHHPAKQISEGRFVSMPLITGGEYLHRSALGWDWVVTDSIV